MVQKLRSLEPEQWASLKEELRSMVLSQGYITDSGFTTNRELYPDNVIPFVEKHIDYLRRHPGIDPAQYIANLKIMTRLRKL
jgi:hypothetical protein